MMIKKFSTGELIKNNYLKTFLLAALTTTVIFLPFVIADKGLFLFYGDFNVQQIPFYKTAHAAVKSGNIWWNFNTDLGANFIGSYSFYLLGSPFFWLTIPFPNDFVPYLMAPLFVLKFSLAATFAYGYIQRFTKSPSYAIIGGLLYSFSGFSVYNIFFNHFNDVIAFFPLMLIALEEFIVNRRRGVFALSVALMATINYFFFAGQVTFILIYFLFRSTSFDFKYNFRQFLLLAFESLLGVAMAAALLLPSYLAIADNPRMDEYLTGWDFLTYSGNVQRYLLIFQSLFFPPDIPARPNFFPDSNAKWSSVSAFLAFFGMTGVIAYLRDHKRDFVKYVLLTCFVMALIPGLNAAFFAFNSAYYARWFYMPILLMALATALSLENKESSMLCGVKWSIVIVAAFSVIGIIPSKDENGILKYFSLPPYPSRFWLSVAIALLGICGVTVLILFFRKHRYFARIATVSVCITSILFSITFIATGKMHSYSYEEVVDMGINAKFDLPESSTGFYRVDVYDGMDNYPMFWRLPTIQAFHSIVPASIMNFYESIEVERGVASRPDIEHYGLRALASVKYLFYANDIDKESPYIPGFEYYDNQNGFTILENTAYVPMGYACTKYITKQQFNDYTNTTKDMLLTEGVLLSDEQIKKYGHLMTPVSDEEAVYINNDDYLENCRVNAANGVSYFSATKDGFKCSISLEKESLVYLSVPFDEGFTAYVNGKQAQIEKVNNGFCAVVAGAGENEIEFVYRTPGLFTGIWITLGAFVVFALYMGLYFMLRRKYPDKFKVLKYRHANNVIKIDTIPAHTAYIKSQLKPKEYNYQEYNQQKYNPLQTPAQAEEPMTSEDDADESEEV